MDWNDVSRFRGRRADKTRGSATILHHTPVPRQMLTPALLVPSLLRILECTKPKVLNIYAQSLHCWPWLCVTVQQVTHRKVGLCSVKVLG